MSLHNFHPEATVKHSILGLVRIDCMFFADDGFGNYIHVDIMQASACVSIEA
jgi:hypothetical protein